LATLVKAMKPADREEFLTDAYEDANRGMKLEKLAQAIEQYRGVTPQRAAS
jgi:hypothetical protein